MELLDLSFLVFMIFSFLSIWTIPMIFKVQNSSAKLPPGPWKLPIIGSIHHLVTAFPHRALRELARRHGPIMHIKLGEVLAVVISSAEAAKEILRTHDIKFADRPESIATTIFSYGGKDIVFSPYGDYWRQYRKICMHELLGPKRVQSFKLIREEEVANLIHSILEDSGSLVNLSHKLFSFTNDVTARAAFGKKRGHNKQAFLNAMKETTVLLGGFHVSDLFPSYKLLPLVTGFRSKVKRMHENLNKISDEIIKEHAQDIVVEKHSHGHVENFVDVLQKLQKEGDLEYPVAIDTMKAIIVDMFTGGSETSSTVMDWLMAELMRNPGVMEKAQAEVRRVFYGKSMIEEQDLQELSYLKLVIKETLRLHPVGPLIPRQCRETCEVNGYEIAAKTKIIVNAWAIGRDPQLWDDSESFKPERFINSGVDFKGSHFEFIPFGAGKRMCPGILFGMANIELPIAHLLYYFDWKLPNGIDHDNLDMTEEFGAVTGRKSDLCMFAAPYKPLC